MNHSEKAKELFLQGYNCTQAVFGAFCEELGMDFDTAIRVSSSFGGGLGRMREVCGAVSGMFFAAGLKYWPKNDPNPGAAKAPHYAIVQELAKRFKDKYKTIVCRELLEGIENSTDPKPSERTENYYKKRPCIEIIGNAAAIFEEYLLENPELVSKK